METFDIVTIGDALIDHFLKIHNTPSVCEVNKETHQVCFLSGSKILVDSSEFALGGNACNVAVGSARLGFRTGIVAEIGDDEFSQKIVAGLDNESVDRTYLKQTPGAASTFSISLSFMGDRTNFIHHIERDHEIDFSSAQISVIYLTSLGKKWKGLYEKTIEYKNAHEVILIFNPGSNQLAEGRESFKDVLKVTDIIIINKEEAEEIVYGAIQHTENHATSRDTLLQELQKLGPKIVCITDGLNGSSVLDQDGNIFSHGLEPGQLVEKTGAGDAFSTGFIASLVLGHDLATALKWGSVNSASVIEHIGAQKGLLTEEELKKRLDK